MRYLALATDYDGTLAALGRVTPRTLTAMNALKASGRKLLLVTGRELPDLHQVCDCLSVFDAVVAENGALYYEPATGERLVLGEKPPEKFLKALKVRNVAPLSVGEVIVSTLADQVDKVLDAIKVEGLELQVIFNKESAMVLPSGINKATGLTYALKRLGLSAASVVGVGDAENDHSFLKACGRSAAVGNALASLKEEVDHVTAASAGDGVAELIDWILKSGSAQLSGADHAANHAIA